eukprot:COSAG06_NODE_14013_length_1197_cov_66.846995_1_plen_128_part_10
MAGAGAPGLSPAEAQHFREHGFIVKRQLLPRAELKPFVDLWWEQRPVREAGLVRGEPATHADPGRHWPEREQQRWGTSSNWMGSDPWPLGRNLGTRSPHNGATAGSSSWKWHALGHSPAFNAATTAHP